MALSSIERRIAKAYTKAGAGKRGDRVSEWVDYCYRTGILYSDLTEREKEAYLRFTGWDDDRELYEALNYAIHGGQNVCLLPRPFLLPKGCRDDISMTEKDQAFFIEWLERIRNEYRQAMKAGIV